MSWDEGLEGAAYHVAAATVSPLRVLAGPGTGKTFALMRRIARLLESGAQPERMLVCTFTRTAALDLIEKVGALGAPGTDQVTVGTLHGLCFGLLQSSAVLQMTGRVPRPLLPFEERFLVEDLKSEGLGGIRACQQRLRAFQAAWARLQSDEPGWPSDPSDQRFQRELDQWLRFHRAMLVGEIVPVTLKHLRENPNSPDRSAFEHVLVDEYQDLNRAEQALLDLLIGDASLAIAGDEDQSIYSFKHAHPEGIAEFDISHPGTVDIPLSECRRCPTRVVELANSLIAHNRHRRQRQIDPRPQNPEGEIHVVQWPNPELEARALAWFVRHKITSGEVGAGSVLVLAPRRQIGYAIRDALNDAGVSAHSFFAEEALAGKPSVLSECGAQSRFTLLTLLANPDDRVALRCWCGFGSPSLRSGAWVRIRSHCMNEGKSPREILEELVSGAITLPRVGEVVGRFRLLRQELEQLNGIAGTQLLDSLFPEEVEMAAGLRDLAESLEEDDYDAEALREALRIGVTQPELPTDVDYVRVMSLHKAKGLTADLVVVCGCIEGLIPHVDYDLPQAEQERTLEEQRRLFYVAITRTRRILVLSSAISMERGPGHRMRARLGREDPERARTNTSRFFGELGSSCPQPVRGDAWLRQIAGDEACQLVGE